MDLPKHTLNARQRYGFAKYPHRKMRGNWEEEDRKKSAINSVNFVLSLSRFCTSHVYGCETSARRSSMMDFDGKTSDAKYKYMGVRC